MSKRGFLFYVLLLVAVGLSVILAVAKINNKIIVARSEERIENSLKYIENSNRTITNEFGETVNLDGVSGYTEVKLSSKEKIDINNQLLDDKIIKELLERRQYIDSKYHLNFNNGAIAENDKIVVLLNLYFKPDNNNLLTATTEELDNKSLEVFGSKINYEGSDYQVVDEKISIQKLDNIESYILKINKVYETKESGVYDIYIDNVYPSNEVDLSQMSSPNVIDYMNSEIVNTYKLTVKKVENGQFNILGVYCYNFKY